MHTSPRRTISLLTFALAAGFLVAPVLGQTTKPNPLRNASRSDSSPVRRASSPEATSEARSGSAPAAIKPTGLQLASHIRPAYRPRQEQGTHGVTVHEHRVLAEEPTIDTNIIGGDLADAIQGEIYYEGDFKGGIVQKDCCGGKGCSECVTIPCPQICFDNIEVRSGVHGFTGPVNRGESGSFGFHEGINWGAPLPCFGGALGMQVGLNATHSNFSGAEFTDETRHQLFLTGGLYRRVDWGLQGGVVIDYLSDDWYADYDVVQLRSEVSWVFPCAHELGFWFTASTNEDTTLSQFNAANVNMNGNETFEGTDLYAFFYRHRLSQCEGGQARLYAGFTGESDGLIGADLSLPLTCDFAIETGFTYLIPEQATGAAPRPGHAEESWNVAISLVWYPGARSAYDVDYFAPLLNVADNGSFMVGRRSP
ncbi:MAG: hypothetical protein CMJ64_20530 [Planctomycetaceae bacterium]|nr:hypothetical protein [Planctomycetaceae bacterium]